MDIQTTVLKDVAKRCQALSAQETAIAKLAATTKDPRILSSASFHEGCAAGLARAAYIIFKDIAIIAKTAKGNDAAESGGGAAADVAKGRGCAPNPGEAK